MVLNHLEMPQWPVTKCVGNHAAGQLTLVASPTERKPRLPERLVSSDATNASSRRR